MSCRLTPRLEGEGLEFQAQERRGGKLGIFPSPRAFLQGESYNTTTHKSQSLYREQKLGIFLSPMVFLYRKKAIIRRLLSPRPYIERGSSDFFSPRVFIQGKSCNTTTHTSFRSSRFQTLIAEIIQRAREDFWSIYFLKKSKLVYQLNEK